MPHTQTIGEAFQEDAFQLDAFQHTQFEVPVTHIRVVEPAAERRRVEVPHESRVMKIDPGMHG